MTDLVTPENFSAAEHAELMLDARGVTKTYRTGAVEVQALADVHLEVGVPRIEAVE